MLQDQFTHAQKSMDQTDELERVKEENSQLKHDILHLKTQFEKKLKDERQQNKQSILDKEKRWQDEK